MLRYTICVDQHLSKFSISAIFFYFPKILVLFIQFHKVNTWLNNGPPSKNGERGTRYYCVREKKKYCVWQGTGIPVQARRSGKKIMAFEELDKKWLVGARRSYLGFAKVESARRGSVIECFQEIIHDHLQLWEGHKTTWIMLRAFQKGAGVDMRLVRLKVKQILQIWHTMITYSLHIMWCGIKKLYVHVDW